MPICPVETPAAFAISFWVFTLGSGSNVLSPGDKTLEKPFCPFSGNVATMPICPVETPAAFAISWRVFTLGSGSTVLSPGDKTETSAF